MNHRDLCQLNLHKTFSPYLWSLCASSPAAQLSEGRPGETPSPCSHQWKQKKEETAAWKPAIFPFNFTSTQHNFTVTHRTDLPTQHGDTSHRPGQAQADQHQGDCGSGECRRAEEGLQPSPALHPGERQKHCNTQGLLLCLGSHCEGSPGGEMDQNTAVLLWSRPKGKEFLRLLIL